MTLKELKGKYARLSNEIDTLAAEGACHEARLMRLISDLDAVHRELCDLRLRTLAAPTLRDTVNRAETAPPPRPVLVPTLPAATVAPAATAAPVAPAVSAAPVAPAAPLVPPVLAPAWSMAS